MLIIYKCQLFKNTVAFAVNTFLRLVPQNTLRGLGKLVRGDFHSIASFLYVSVLDPNAGRNGDDDNRQMIVPPPLSRLWPNRSVAIMLSTVVLLLPVITLGGWAFAVRASGNVHEVEQGRLYRSAQLSGSSLNEQPRLPQEHSEDEEKYLSSTSFDIALNPAVWPASPASGRRHSGQLGQALKSSRHDR